MPLLTCYNRMWVELWIEHGRHGGEERENDGNGRKFLFGGSGASTFRPPRPRKHTHAQTDRQIFLPWSFRQTISSESTERMRICGCLALILFLFSLPPLLPARSKFPVYFLLLRCPFLPFSHFLLSFLLIGSYGVLCCCYFLFSPFTYLLTNFPSQTTIKPPPFKPFPLCSLFFSSSPRTCLLYCCFFLAF